MSASRCLLIFGCLLTPGSSFSFRQQNNAIAQTFQQYRTTLGATSSTNMVLSRREIVKTAFLSFLATYIATPTASYGYEPDVDPLRESLYLISRVQEATVQQERFVRKATDQKALQNKMKLTLLLIEKNYKLVDQVTYCSTFIPSEHLVEATEAGNEAAEELQSAIDFVRAELKSGPLDPKQKDVINDALRTTRESLFIFLDFLPQEKIEQAHKRVEEENKANIEEFDGDEDAGVYNPVMLPWKNRNTN